MTDVLFVDDDAFILSCLRRLFRREEFSFATAGGAREAMEMLETEAIPVIVSDYMMPEINGVELLATVKKRWPGTTRLILSGYSDMETINDAISKGIISRFLNKPWDDEELKNIIRETVQSAQAAGH